MRFYSTYEELKLFIKSVAFCNVTRFYSTYEELKLKKKIETIGLLKSFYSTYEELKPHYDSKDYENWFCVFTLPMRN